MVKAERKTYDMGGRMTITFYVQKPLALIRLYDGRDIVTDTWWVQKKTAHEAVRPLLEGRKARRS